jgi:hypothetical protein
MDFQEAITKIFFGTIPEPLKYIPSNAGAIIAESIKKQGVQHAQDLNYAQFIADGGYLFAGAIAKEGKEVKPLSPDELLHHQYVNRIAMKHLYYITVQDKDESVFIKAESAFFYRNFIETATKIYGIDIIQGQDEFIKELIEDEREFQRQIDEINELLKKILEPPATTDVSGFWPDSQERLIQLSDKLFEMRFIADAASFVQTFSKESASTCKWLKTIASFMYLIHLLFKEKENDKLMVICDFLSDRVTFKKGNHKTGRLLRQTLRNIENTTALDRRFLSGDYGRLYDIHHSICS